MAAFRQGLEEAETSPSSISRRRIKLTGCRFWSRTFFVRHSTERRWCSASPSMRPFLDRLKSARFYLAGGTADGLMAADEKSLPQACRRLRIFADLTDTLIV